MVSFTGGAPNSWSYDFVIAKFDSDLNLVKIKNFGSSWEDKFERVIEDTNGDFVAIWNSDGDLTSFIGGSLNSWVGDFVIAKFDSNLNLEKINSLGSSRGNLSWFTWGNTNTSTNSDFLIIKYTGNLAIEKVAYFGNTDSDDFYDILKDSNGDFIVVWNSSSDLSILTGGTDTEGGSDFVIAKLDTELNLEKISNFGSSSTDVGFFIVEDINGDFVIVWDSSWDLSSLTWWTNTEELSDFVIAKLDTELNLEKINNFGFTGSDILKSVTEDSNGDFIVAWNSSSDLSILTGGTDTQGGSDFVIAKLDAELNLEKINNLWGTSWDYMYTVLEDSAGNYISVWHTYGDLDSLPGGTTKVGGHDFVIAKFQGSSPEEVLVTKIDGWFFHSCKLELDSTVSCWGRNNKGQLWDGTINKRTTPVEILTE